MPEVEPEPGGSSQRRRHGQNPRGYRRRPGWRRRAAARWRRRRRSIAAGDAPAHATDPPRLPAGDDRAPRDARGWRLADDAADVCRGATRRTYDGWGYSPLREITPANVRRLRPVWVFSTGEARVHESAPIVNGGVMFVTSPHGQVIAIDARTGNQLWRYRRPAPPAGA